MNTCKLLCHLQMLRQKDLKISPTYFLRHRFPKEVLFSVGGRSGGGSTNYIESYDTGADRWVKADEVDPTGSRAFHGTAVVGFNVYVISGFDREHHLQSCSLLQRCRGNLALVSPLYDCRCHVTVSMIGEPVYAKVGYDGYKHKCTADLCDYQTVR
jgi:kelch-like protein 10